MKEFVSYELLEQLFQNKIIIENPYLVVVRFEQEETNAEIEKLLKGASKRFLLKSKSVMNDEQMEVTYEVRLKGNDVAFVSTLSKVEGEVISCDVKL